MSALVLTFLLAGGSFAYALLSRDLSATLSISGWWFVAAAPAVYLFIPFIITTFWFSCNRILRDGRAPSAPLSTVAFLRCFAGEVLALARDILLMASHRLLISEPKPRSRAGEEHPVLLVHGLLCNDGIWTSALKALREAGVGPLYTLNYWPPLASIERFVTQLAQRIEKVCAATGASRVILIGHSMGGLIVRAYVRRYGAARVVKIITLGTPHEGSVLARLAPGTCVKQMRPGNAWLESLNRTHSSVPLVSIWSQHDNMVLPAASAALPAAKNIVLSGIAHLALLHNRRVHEILCAEARGDALT